MPPLPKLITPPFPLTDEPETEKTKAFPPGVPSAIVVSLPPVKKLNLTIVSSPIEEVVELLLPILIAGLPPVVPPEPLIVKIAGIGSPIPGLPTPWCYI